MVAARQPGVEVNVHRLDGQPGSIARTRRLGILLATAEEHPNTDTVLGLVRASEERGDEVLLYLNVSGGEKWTRQVLSTKGSHDIVLTDIGGDGDLDIVGANHGGDYQNVELWENLTAGKESKR